METNVNTDFLIHQMGGCGIFQIVITAFVSLTYVSGSFTLIFMSFGSYNPGWRCLDSNDIIVVDYGGSETSTTHGLGNVSKLFYNFTQSCQGYSDCENVEFNPEASTIITEWGLICDKKWCASTIMAVQMGGMTLGHLMSGYFCDKFGRKLTLYTNMFIHTFLTFLTLASVTWEMFTAIRLVLGFTVGMILSSSDVLMTEYVTPKWRAVIPSLPQWSTGCILMSLTSMLFKDWRYLHLFNGVFSFVVFLPVLVLPESLRWLIIHKKEKKSRKTVTHIVKFNKVPLREGDYLNRIFEQEEKRDHQTTNMFSFIDLFSKETRWYTISLGFVIIVTNIIYFVSSFGVSALPGDLYINSIILYVTELPANIIGLFAPNKLGRKRSGFLFCLFISVSIFSYVVFYKISTGGVEVTGMLVSIVIARIFVDIMWFIVIIYAGELYPTTHRGVSVGFMMFISGCGSVIAPYLLSNEENTLFISYIVLAVLCLMCCIPFIFLPETSNKDLKDHSDQMDEI